MKECKRFEKLLPGYLHGELYEKEYHVLRAHLEKCPSCRAELEALHATYQLAGKVMAAVPTPVRMSAWRHLPRRNVDIRTGVFARIWFSPQFKAALATIVIALGLFSFSSMFVVFRVVEVPEAVFEAPPPMPRPRLKLKKLQRSSGIANEATPKPKLGKNIVAKPRVTEMNYSGVDLFGAMPEVAGERADSGFVDDSGSGLGFSMDIPDQYGAQPHMSLKKPRAEVAKGSQPQSSSRIVAKVKTKPMPDIQLPDMVGTGEGLLGSTVAGGDEFLELPEISERVLFGCEAAAEPEPAPVQLAKQERYYADPFSDEASDAVLSTELRSRTESLSDRIEPQSGGTYDYIQPAEAEEYDGMDDLFGGGMVVNGAVDRDDSMDDLFGGGDVKGAPLCGGSAFEVVTSGVAVPMKQKSANKVVDFKEQKPEKSLSERGKELYLEGNYGEARLYFEAVLAEDPYNKQAMKDLRQTAQMIEAQGEPGREVVRDAAVADIERGWSAGYKDDLAVQSRERKPAVYNPYVMAAENAFSTFAIDVDTASYGLARRQLLAGTLPETEAVRTEEFVNSFDYDYRPPAGKQTFAIHTEMAPSPFRGRLDLLKVGIKGRRIGRDDHRNAVLTLVIDTSGSMSTPERLGLVKESLSLLLDQLNPDDKVAIVQFGGDAHLVLEHTPAGEKDAVLAAINALQPGGPTQFDKGLELGYQLATDGFKAGDSNRIIIMSDGVANLGELDPDAILEQVAEYRTKGVYLSVLGFGAGTYDDELLERLANRGDGMYAYVDTLDDARQLFVDRLASTLHVIASDVKIQVEFNPDRVLRYRQLGYENRQLTKEQFRDDTVDAGEVGSGQSVTALYDVELKPDGMERDPIATVYVRYRRADNSTIEEISSRVMDTARKTRFEDADPRFKLAACVAEFAERLRRSPYAEGTETSEILGRLQPVVLALELDDHVHELQQLISIAAGLEK